MGLAQSKSGDRKAAISSIRRAVEIMDNLVTDHPDVLKYQELLANYYNGLGMLQGNANDLDGAITSFRNGVTIAEKLALENPQVSAYRASLALSYGNLGLAYGRGRKREEQLDSLTRAAEIIQKLADDSPDVPATKANLAGSYDRLGGAYAQSDVLGGCGDGNPDCFKDPGGTRPTVPERPWLSGATGRNLQQPRRPAESRRRSRQGLGSLPDGFGPVAIARGQAPQCSRLSASPGYGP